MAAEESMAVPTTTFKPIETSPQAGQSITHEGHEYTTIKEGLAHILVPHGTPTITDPKMGKEDAARQSVFYQPVQQYNRDLSVLAIEAFGKDFLFAKECAMAAKQSGAKRKRRTQGNNKAQLKTPLEQEAEGVAEAMSAKKTGIEGDKKGQPKRPLEQESDELPEAPSAKTLNTEGNNKAPKKRPLEEDSEDLREATTMKRLNTRVDQNELAPISEGDQSLPNNGTGSSEVNKETSAAANSAEATSEEAMIKQIVGDSEAGVNQAIVTQSAPSDPLANECAEPPTQTRRIPFRILDALSATGLRALRYAQEIPFVTAVTANDMSSKACESIALNIKHNRLEDKIKANTGNAIHHMYGCLEKKKEYEVVDLDPYGTAAPFLDAAVQAVCDGGLLCVTCTDSALFASVVYMEKTFANYGGLPIKGTHSHEGGIRLILHSVASSAARYGASIEPLLSLSIDYYIRIFVRVRKSPAEVKLLAGKTMMVYSCDNGCGAWQKQFLARHQPCKNKNGETFYKFHLAQAPSADQTCEHCGSKTHLSGPMYGGPIHNPAFIERILEELPKLDRATYPTIDRIEGMLITARDEITYGVENAARSDTLSDLRHTHKDRPGLDRTFSRTDPAQVDAHPFFFIPSNLARVLHCEAPALADINGALRHAGFRVSRSHCKPGSIRTDASWADIWHIMREWVRQRAPLVNPSKRYTAGWQIMQKGDAHDNGDATVSGTEENAEGERRGEDEKAEGAEITDAAKTENHSNASSRLGARFPVVFDEKLGGKRNNRDTKPDGKRLVRYQVNPRENWGPMTRAKNT